MEMEINNITINRSHVTWEKGQICRSISLGRHVGADFWNRVAAWATRWEQAFEQCQMIEVDTIVGDCNNRENGPKAVILVGEGGDYVGRCRHCGAPDVPTVRNDADCTCWTWISHCTACGQSDFQ